MSSAIEEKWSEIKLLMAQRDYIVGKLDRSFILQRLWPQAFEDGGKVTTYVSGNPFDLLIFKVRRAGDGEEQAFPLLDVPVELWPDEVIADVRGVRGTQTRYLMRLRRYLHEELDRISG